MSLQVISKYAGTEIYMAPECLVDDLDSKQVGFASDVWVLGMILYEMLSKQYPFRYNPDSIVNE